MTNPYWQRQHQRYVTGGGVSGRYPKQEKAMDEQQENMWVRTGAQLHAARAMLAALEHIADRVRGPNDALKGDIDRIARSAIAQAEAAGITTGEDDD
jgi:hypothetical protein